MSRDHQPVADAHTLADESTENTPLLPSHSSNRGWSIRKWRHSPSFLTSVVTLVVILVSFADQIAESPQTRILESIICYRHYEKTDPSKITLGRAVVGPGAIGGVDEHWCKNATIQTTLAELFGYMQLLDGIPGLILAIPFGWAADRWGRWPFVFLNLVQFTLRCAWVQVITWYWQSFDIRAIYFQSILSLLGGGNSIISALFYVIISDISAPEERAAAFLRLGAANLSANLFMPPLSAWLMTISPWIPSLLGLGFFFAGTLAFLLVPETLNHRRVGSSPESDPLVPSVENVQVPDDEVDRASTKQTSGLSFLVEDWRIVGLIMPFTAHILIASLTKLLLQYVSTRYDLTFSKSTLLVTIKSGVTVGLLFIALPYLTTSIMRIYHLSGQQKDLLLARASQILVAVGWILVAASPNIPTVAVSLAIASSGAGAIFLIRSLLTSLVPAHHIARVYTVIGMVDTVGTMAGAPFLAWLFSRGLELGGGWIGLPFYFIGGMAALFAVLLFFIRLEGTTS